MLIELLFIQGSFWKLSIKILNLLEAKFQYTLVKVLENLDFKNNWKFISGRF